MNANTLGAASLLLTFGGYGLCRHNMQWAALVIPADLALAWRISRLPTDVQDHPS